MEIVDSVFLLDPPMDQVEQIIQWAEEHLDLDLELDKTYKFLALSKRKKNYIGVKQGGEIDIKGLLAKKHNTPEFIKKRFNVISKILKEISDEASFKEKRDEIGHPSSKKRTEWLENLWKREASISLIMELR